MFYWNCYWDCCICHVILMVWSCFIGTVTGTVVFVMLFPWCGRVLQVIVLAPEQIPFAQLGPFGSFCSYLVENLSGLMFKM